MTPGFGSVQPSPPGAALRGEWRRVDGEFAHARGGEHPLLPVGGPEIEHVPDPLDRLRVSYHDRVTAVERQPIVPERLTPTELPQEPLEIVGAHAGASCEACLIERTSSQANSSQSKRSRR
jgi:hypothetical protein